VREREVLLQGRNKWRSADRIEGGTISICIWRRGVEVRRWQKDAPRVKKEGPVQWVLDVRCALSRCSHAVARRFASLRPDIVQPRSGGESDPGRENNKPLSTCPLFHDVVSHISRSCVTWRPNAVHLDRIFADHRR
jgi:hypothetical protein